MSDTPRTDEFQQKLSIGGQLPYLAPIRVMADFARELECELAHRDKRIAELEKELAEAKALNVSETHVCWECDLIEQKACVAIRDKAEEELSRLRPVVEAARKFKSEFEKLTTVSKDLPEYMILAVTAAEKELFEAVRKLDEGE